MAEADTTTNDLSVENLSAMEARLVRLFRKLPRKLKHSLMRVATAYLRLSRSEDYGIPRSERVKRDLAKREREGALDFVNVTEAHPPHVAQ